MLRVPDEIGYREPGEDIKSLINADMPDKEYTISQTDMLDRGEYLLCVYLQLFDIAHIHLD